MVEEQDPGLIGSNWRNLDLEPDSGNMNQDLTVRKDLGSLVLEAVHGIAVVEVHSLQQRYGEMCLSESEVAHRRHAGDQQEV
jgi:hypothetical protein